MELTLSPSQILIIGIASTLLVSFLTWLIEKAIPGLLAKRGKTVSIDLSRFVKTLIVGAVAFGFAWWWYPVSLPALPAFSGSFGAQTGQFFTWAALLVAALMPYVGSAMSLYNLLLSYLVDPDKRLKVFQTLLDNLFKSGSQPAAPTGTPSGPGS